MTFKLSIAIFVFSTLIFESPAIFDEWFRYDHEIHDHSTRASTEVIRENYFDVGHVQQTYTLHTKGANNNYGGKMIQVLGPLIWNDIPEAIQEAGTIATFKKNLKIYIFNQYIGDPVANRNRNNGRNRNNVNNNNQRWRQNVSQPFISRWNQQPN